MVKQKKKEKIVHVEFTTNVELIYVESVWAYLWLESNKNQYINIKFSKKEKGNVIEFKVFVNGPESLVTHWLKQLGRNPDGTTKDKQENSFNNIHDVMGFDLRPKEEIQKEEEEENIQVLLDDLYKDLELDSRVDIKPPDIDESLSHLRSVEPLEETSLLRKYNEIKTGFETLKEDLKHFEKLMVELENLINKEEEK